ncbi:unnamed protein product [Candida parapsilosis]
MMVLPVYTSSKRVCNCLDGLHLKCVIKKILQKLLKLIKLEKAHKQAS